VFHGSKTFDREDTTAEFHTTVYGENARLTTACPTDVGGLTGLGSG
jgi:hypothetical protein